MLQLRGKRDGLPLSCICLTLRSRFSEGFLELHNLVVNVFTYGVHIFIVYSFRGFAEFGTFFRCQFDNFRLACIFELLDHGFAVAESVFLTPFTGIGGRFLDDGFLRIVQAVPCDLGDDDKHGIQNMPVQRNIFIDRVEPLRLDAFDRILAGVDTPC